MFQTFREKMKDQRGLTLIELLAVIVILGIIAAIAVPSILGIINNSKKDAHVANAQQIVSSAKLYIADAKIDITTTGTAIDLTTLIDKGYVEDIDDPSGADYDTSATKVYVKKIEGATATDPDTIEYKVSVTSVDSNGATAGGVKYYIGVDGAAANAVEISTLDRDDVDL